MRLVFVAPLFGLLLGCTPEYVSRIRDARDTFSASPTPQNAKELAREVEERVNEPDYAEKRKFVPDALTALDRAAAHASLEERRELYAFKVALLVDLGDLRGAVEASRMTYRASAAEIDAAIAKNLVGYVPSGAPIVRALDSFEPILVPVERGTCYRVVFHVVDGDVPPGIHLSADATTDHRPRILWGGLSAGPAGIDEIGCAWMKDSYLLKPSWRRETIFFDDTPANLLSSKGRISVQLFVRKISEEEVEADEHRIERNVAAAHEAERVQEQEQERLSRDKQRDDAARSSQRTGCRKRCDFDYDQCSRARGAASGSSCELDRGRCYDSCN